MRARRRPAPRVFVSYRREDASGHAGRLYDVLAARFGASNVFMDVDTIEVGTDFAQAIERAVVSCDAVIALIGRHWLAAADAEGRRRLDDPNDFVRLELEAALARDISVVPACVQGARHPAADDLPASLAPLARRQGVQLDDEGWHDDVARLVERLERTVAPEPVRDQPHRRTTRRALALAAAAAAVLLAAAAALLLLRDDGGEGGAGGNFPNADERRLLAVVPAITRTQCERIDYGDEAATASVECSGGAGTSVTYNLFESTQVRDAWYQRTREEAGVEPDGGTCTPEAFRGETAYGAGRYVCWSDGGEPLLAWTHGATGVAAKANSWQRKGESGARTLFRQWQCCMRPQTSS